MTQSTFANRSAQKRYARITSRDSRIRNTVRAAMEADAERGQRIKQLREDQHLTQQALADKIPVTLRALQAWESGGGITWENVKALAKHVHAKPEYILNGETPDMLGSLNGIPPKLQKQLDHITELLENLAEVNRELLVPYLSRTAPKKRAARRPAQRGSTPRQQTRSAKRKAA